MLANGKFKPGQSGNPRTRFKPGKTQRWEPGQSGNPDGITRRRLEFDKAFYEVLLGQGAAEEEACLLWDAARDREPWAVQGPLQRLASEAKQSRLKFGGTGRDELERIFDKRKRGDLSRAKKALSEHMGHLILTPAVLDGRPVYQVSGGLTPAPPLAGKTTNGFNSGEARGQEHKAPACIR